MILVDTFLWIDRLRKTEPALVAALETGQVLMHPFVAGEPACGKLRSLAEVLSLLRGLSAAPVATHAQALGFIERHELMGRGIGYLDVHLLASVALASPARVWTRDKRLATVADHLKLTYQREAR